MGPRVPSMASAGKEDRKPVSWLYLLSPEDLALLVHTPEPSVVIQALNLLYELMQKKPEEVGEKLIGGGLLEGVISLQAQAHPLYNAARYRFLAKMYLVFPAERHRLLENRSGLLSTAIDQALATDDTALKGYALQYLSLLTQDLPQELLVFLEKYDMNKLFSFLNEADVDVQNNTLALLKNLLRCELTKDSILVLVEDVHLKRMLVQVACPYPEIQENALDLLYLIVSPSSQYSKWLQELFTNTGGLDLIFVVLFVFYWRDLHEKCFKILWCLTDTTKHILNMDSVDGLQKLVNYIPFIEDDLLQELDLDIIIKAANFPDARLVLSKLGVVEALMGLLKSGSEHTMRKAVQAVGLLSRPPADLAQFSRIDLLPPLLILVKDAECSVELRRSAARTLATLVKEVPAAALSLSKRDNFLVLESVLEDRDLADIDCLVEVLGAMLTVLGCPTHLDQLLTKRLTSLALTIANLDVRSLEAGSGCKGTAVFSLVESHRVILAAKMPAEDKCSRLSVPALGILSLSLARKKGRYMFVSDRGVTDVMKLLYMSQEKDVIEAVGLLLTAAFQHLSLTQNFIRAGISSWFQSCGRMWVKRTDCPQLASALSALYKSDLSLKLEMLGRLDLWDLTSDGFYVYRSPARPRQDLQLIRATDIDPDTTIFYLKMALESTQHHQSQDSHSLFNIADESDICLNEEESHGSSYSKSTENLMEDLVVDVRLLEIYENLKRDICESNIGSSWEGGSRCGLEAELAGLIGRAVARAMSGEMYNGQCTNHTFQLHMNQLRAEYESGYIPIGALEVGLKLERSILFKVLADRVGLPCALVRGGYATGWVEVSLLPRSESPYQRLPPRELTPSHIVDLVQKPGYLIPLEMGLAMEYQRPPNFTSQPAPPHPDSSQDSPHQPAKYRQHFHIKVDEPPNKY